MAMFWPYVIYKIDLGVSNSVCLTSGDSHFLDKL